MKKTLFSLSLLIFLGSGLSAQKDSTRHKEIIVEKKINDGKPEKTIIIIDGDKVTVNGEEVKDFNGKLDIQGNGSIDFQNFEKAFNADKLDFKKLGDNFANANKMFRRAENTFQSNKAMLGVVTEKDERGAKVTDITGESSAAKAGLAEGDIITAINADKITDGNELVKAIGKYKPDEKITITVLRSGKQKKLTATLGKNASPFSGKLNWNMNEEVMPPLPPMDLMPNGDLGKLNEINRFPEFIFNNDRPKFGFGIKDNENGDGAVVTNIKEDGAAAKAGLKENDIITDVAGTLVKTTDDLKRLLAESREKTEVIVKLLRNGSAQTLTLKVPKKIKTAEL